MLKRYLGLAKAFTEVLATSKANYYKKVRQKKKMTHMSIEAGSVQSRLRCATTTATMYSYQHAKM